MKTTRSALTSKRVVFSNTSRSPRRIPQYTTRETSVQEEKEVFKKMNETKKLLTKRMIRNAIDMVQIVRDDVDRNFIIDQNDKEIKRRGELISSSLSVLSAYLLHICEEVSA